jgi:hypothetical protein
MPQTALLIKLQRTQSPTRLLSCTCSFYLFIPILSFFSLRDENEGSIIASLISQLRYVP